MGKYAELAFGFGAKKTQRVITRRSNTIDAKQYVEFVKTQPCCLCHDPNYPVDAHHMQSRGSGGSDFSCVPLCRECHACFHSEGGSRIREKFGVDLWRELSGLLVTFMETESQ